MPSDVPACFVSATLAERMPDPIDTEGHRGMSFVFLSWWHLHTLCDFC